MSLSNNLQVRIDLPGEDEYLFDHWHQDYPSAMVSQHGCVLWIPLNDITMDMGPGELLAGSHRRGLQRVRLQEGRYFAIDDKDFLASCPSVCIEVEAGDVVVFDLMLAHRSSRNVSSRPRWTATFRYCDMREKVSVVAGWPGYYSQGKHFTKVHPDYVASQ